MSCLGWVLLLIKTLCLVLQTTALVRTTGGAVPVISSAPTVVLARGGVHSGGGCANSRMAGMFPGGIEHGQRPLGAIDGTSGRVEQNRARGGGAGEKCPKGQSTTVQGPVRR